MAGIPTNTTCWFMVTVKSTTEIDSNNVSCYKWPSKYKLLADSWLSVCIEFDDKPYDDKLCKIHNKYQHSNLQFKYM